MIAYIIFEKQEEDGRPPWDAVSAHEFIKQRQADPDGNVGKLTGLYEKAAPGCNVVIAEFENSKDAQRHALRVVPISSTVVYIIEDDPALDDFLELAPAEEGSGESFSVITTPRPTPRPSSIEQHADLVRTRLALLAENED